MEGNIFEKILGQDSLFLDRKAFDHAFEPTTLPHRDREVEALVRNLVDALNGHIPSNMLLYGVPGSGKTVVTRFVLGQLRDCLLYTSPSPRDQRGSRMPSSA